MTDKSDNTEPPAVPTRRKGRLFCMLRKRGLGILVVLVAGAILACLMMFLPKKDDSKPTLPPEPIPVNIEVVKPLDSLEDNMELYGRVEPDKVVEVAAEISARVRSYAGRQDKLTKDFRIIASPA